MLSRQVFLPGKVIFTGVGVLLLVRILLDNIHCVILTLIPRLSGCKGCPEEPRNTH